jgi:ankyrin repeat protein
MAMTSSLVQTVVLVIVVVALLVVFWRLTASRAAAMAPPPRERRAPFQRPERPTPALGEPSVDDGTPTSIDAEAAPLSVGPAALVTEPEEPAVDLSAEAVPLLRAEDPLATEAINAIRGGDIARLGQLLAAHPELARARLRYQNSIRTLLHVATDWPGHFPNGPATVVVLVAAGADVNAHVSGPHAETPLHWAASSNDVLVIDALIEAGADVEADGSVVDGGSPLSDAVAFGQWQAARRLVERGARTTLWHAAALGLIERMGEHFADDPPPSRNELTNALWCACHGGQQGAAELLLERGADLNWVGHDHLTPLDAAERSGAHDLAGWLRQHGARSARDPA